MSKETKKKFKNNKLQITEETETICLTEILSENDFHTADSNFDTAIKFLQRKKDILNKDFNRDEQKIKVNYTLKAFAEEGAYAVHQAVVAKYGQLDMNNKTGPSMDRLPELIDVKLPDGSSVKVPWGIVSLPSFDDDSTVEMSYDSEDHLFKIIGTVKNKYTKELQELVDSVQKNLDLNSIYKGNAITLSFDDDGYYLEPEFMDLSNIDESKIVLSKSAQEDLTPIFVRIEKTEECIKSGLDLKYGALMEGIYGTGKTLAASYVAKKATANKWTYIYLKDCKYTAEALKICEQYIHGGTGVVLFTEDIDQALRGERDSDMQEILNTMDGVDTKCKPIISIFTTNHIEKIEPTFMRGKRIGGLISLGALDEETAERFIKVMVPSKEAGIAITASEAKAAAKHLEGIVPAFAAEAIDKAKIFMLGRSTNKMNAEDIRKAAESYKKQIIHSAMKEKVNEYNELSDALGIVGKHLSGGDNPVGDEMFEYLKKIAYSTYNRFNLDRKK